MNYSSQKQETSYNYKWSQLDLIILLLFTCYATLHFLGRWKGAIPFHSFYSSDATDICGFAAGRSFPELFPKDGILFSSENYDFYSTVQIPILQFMTKLTGDCGLSFILFFIPLITLQLAGFYILGKILFKNRFWSLLLAFLSLSPMETGFNTFWGLAYEPIPRIWFQALLPFLLSLALLWNKEVKKWPLLMIFAGLLMYVHPVSAPTWGFAVWIGLVFCMPSGWTIFKKVTHAVFTGLIFALTISPFLFIYLTTHEHGSTIDYQLVNQILRERVPEFHNLSHSFMGFLESIFKYWVIIVFGFIGYIYVYITQNKERKYISIVTFWLIGIVITTVLIPLIDHATAAALNQIPVQLDLVRNLRYLLPILEIGMIWGLLFTANRFTKTVEKSLVHLVGIIILFAFPPPIYDAQHALTNILSGNLVPEETDTSRFTTQNLELIKKSVPEKNPIFVAGGIDGLVLRYSAKRPVVYLEKDGGVLIYGNHEALLKWFDTRNKLNSINNIKVQLDDLIRLARDSGAIYLTLGFKVTSEELATLQNVSLVNSNKLSLSGSKTLWFSLLKIN